MKIQKVKKNKITIEDIIIFCFACVLFSLIQIMFVCTIGIISFSVLIYGCLDYLKNKKAEKRADYWANIFLSILFWFMYLDTMMTYFVVYVIKAGQELNPIVIFLWNNFGIYGELIRLSLLFLIHFSIFYNFHYGNKKQKLLAIILLIFCVILWTLVIGHNFVQLFTLIC